MPSVNENQPGVSLIICVYNGADRIVKTLDHIQRQVVKGNFPWEVIIVDDTSTDRTIVNIRNAWQSGIPLRIANESHRGMAYARVRGIEEASYEFISFIDDDNHIADNWVDIIYRTFYHNPEIAMCGGQNIGVFEIPPPSWILSVMNCYAIGKQGDETGDVTDSRGFLWGAGLSFRKSVFEKLKRAGFDFQLKGRIGKKMMAGEDTELSLAFIAGGYRLWYIDDLRLEHYMPAERLRWENAKQLFKGLGEAEYILDLYRIEIHRNPFPFLKMYSRLMCFILVYFGWRLIALPKDQRNNPRYLSYLARKSYILNALSKVGNYRGRMKEIRYFHHAVIHPVT